MPAAPSYRVISIGTLAAHPLWDERAAVRTGHATTMLISSADETEHILVDPSLPAQALLARLSERTRVRPEAITQVFLTSFEPERRRALRAFEDAEWLVHEPERRNAMTALRSLYEEAASAGDDEMAALHQAEIELLERCRPAPDSLAPHVDLFPLPGVTPGTCGMLIALPGSTVLVCGDAIPTVEHLAQGKVLPYCADVERAQESFREAVEIADILILGRDNMTFNPLRRL